LEIRPHPGVEWARQGQVRRLPATYKRPHGTRYLLAAYDVPTQALWGAIYQRQTWTEVLDFLKAVRRRYPDNRWLHVVLDNRGSHKKQAVRQWCATNRVRLVFQPTYSSWLNRIECHFTALKKFALSGRYFKDHAEQNAAIFNYLMYRAALKTIIPSKPC
jgi:transposase